MHPLSHPSTPNLPAWNENTVHRLAAEYCEFGETLLASQDYHRARSVYQIAIDYSPQLAVAHYGIARAQYYLSNYCAALTAVNRAISHCSRIDFYYHRILINNALNDDGNGANSDLPIASSAPNLVDLQLHETEFDRLALANFDLYIEAHLQDANGYYYRGMYYARLERYHLALADFDRAIFLQADTVLFHQARGCAHQHLGNYAAALADYDFVIRLQSTLAAGDNRDEMSQKIQNYRVSDTIDPRSP